MLSPVQNAAVVSWLRNNSKRPMAAMSVWAILFTGLRMDTGEIVLKRDEIAKRAGIAPQSVSNEPLAKVLGTAGICEDAAVMILAT